MGIGKKYVKAGEEGEWTHEIMTGAAPLCQAFPTLDSAFQHNCNEPPKYSSRILKQQAH